MGLLVILLAGVGLLLLIAFGIFIALNIQTRQHRKFFKRRGVPFYENGPADFMAMIRGKLSLIEIELIMYKEGCEKGKPLIGMSNPAGPLHYVTDLELMKHIYVKDFDHFVNRRALTTVDTDMFSKMLISMEGDHWKGMRSKLSPTFTTGKIRRMFDIFIRSSEKMCDYLKRYVEGGGSDHDICKVYSKYAMDVIANCAFGIDSKTFDRSLSEKSEFEKMGNRFQLQFSFKTMFKFFFVSCFPKIAKALGIYTFDGESQHYFTNVIKQVIKRRRDTGERQEDFLQLMIDAQEGLLKSEENSKETLEVMTGSQTNGGDGADSKNIFSASDKLKMDDDAIIANCELFLLAGFDTLQSLLIFCTYALAKEQEIQETLFQEVEKTFSEHGGKLNYDAMNQMQFLDLVINETLRYYAPSGRTERVCTKDFPVPGTNLVLKKGDIVAIPIIGVHRDEKYYKDPEKFDPYRFTNERKAERHPYAFAPFGHGPRNCIGMRFALTEVKALICHMVHEFKLEPCSRTEFPPKYTNSASLKPANGMWLKIQPRNLKHEE